MKLWLDLEHNLYLFFQSFKKMCVNIDQNKFMKFSLDFDMLYNLICNPIFVFELFLWGEIVIMACWIFFVVQTYVN